MRIFTKTNAPNVLAKAQQAAKVVDAAIPKLETAETFIEKLERLQRERKKREEQLPLPLPLPAEPTLTGGQFSGNIKLNEEQQKAIRLMTDFSVKEFPIYGSAGTGKTTLLREAVSTLIPLLPLLGHEHKTLSSAAPAIAVVAYTRRAVKNLRRALSPINMSHLCCTVHKLLEYAPEYYDDFDSDGNIVNKMRFVAGRNRMYPLAGLKLIVIDEAGMLSVELYEEILQAKPADCRVIFLGDLFQLAPVYDTSILGFKLADAADGKIPHVELTQVYRQALDSPILSKALQVKDGNCPEFQGYLCNKFRKWESPTGDSILSVNPIQEASKDPEILNPKFGALFRKSYMEGRFDPTHDVVLIPHGKPHTFGSYQLNLHIAQAITDKNDLDVYEVYSGFNKLYLCIGDRVAIGPNEGIITAITKNGRYFGKQPRPPSKGFDRWGRRKLGVSELNQDAIDFGSEDTSPRFSLGDIDNFLDTNRLEDRKAQASHIITIQLEDSDEIMEFCTASELNLLSFTYVLTCHKAQGAEWRKVYIILHHVHAGMYSREWLYTAMTRASKECHILARPQALQKCVERSQIKGITLAEKAEYFKGKKQVKEDRVRTFGPRVA